MRALHAAVGNGAVARAVAGREAAAGEKAKTRGLDLTSAGGALRSLAAVAPSAFPAALAQVTAATPQMQSSERRALAATLPVIERPTGMPRAPKREVPKEGAGDHAGKQTTDETEHGTPAADGAAPAQSAAPDEDADRAPTSAAEAPVATDEPAPESGRSWWDWLVGGLQNLIAGLPSHDDSISTSAGERPTVQLGGRSDPARNAERQQAGAEQVAQRHAAGDAQSQVERGEHGIAPTVPEEQLHATLPDRTPPTPGAAPVAGPGLPPAQQAAFDQNAAPWLHDKVQEKIDEHEAAQADYAKQSDEIHREGKRRLAEADKQARGQQEATKAGALAEIGEARVGWRKENQKLAADYDKQSNERRRETDNKIDEKVKSTNRDVDHEMTAAENRAKEEQRKTEDEVARKKREAENRPRSTWEKIKGAISSVFAALKKLVNKLFDALRWLVKKIISAVKKLVRAWIELARLFIVGLITAFGEIVKGLVRIALIGYPETADRWCRAIDRTRDRAIDKVNAAAEALKKAADAVLDWVGKALDTALAFVQKLYCVYLDFLRLVCTGDFVTLWRKLKALGQAAWDGFGLIEGEIWKELLGFDLTQPLGPQLHEQQSGEEGASSEGADPANLAFLQQESIANDQVVVDPVGTLDPNDVPPELGLMQPGATMTLGTASGSERSTNGVMEGLLGHLPQEPAASESETSSPSPQAEADGAAVAADPEMRGIMERLVAATTRAERLSALKDLMWAGLKKFWREKVKPNLWWIIPAALVALAAFIAAEVLTGGAITAALPVIMEIIGVIFLGYDAIRVAAGLGEYLSLAWDEKIPQAAKAFAHAIAVGVVAVVTFLLFEGVGKALKVAFKAMAKGARVVGRAGAALVRTTARAATAAVRGLIKGVLYVGRMAIKAFRVVARMVSRAGSYVLERGKLIFKGLAKLGSEVGESIEKLFTKLKSFFGHFRGFVARRHGDWLDVYAEFNPTDILVLRIPITLASDLRDALIEEHGIAGYSEKPHATGVATEAGTPGPERTSGYGRFTDPNQEAAAARRLGREMEPPFAFKAWRKGDRGIPGRFFSSHAEPKLAAALADAARGSGRMMMGVNKVLCDQCPKFFERLAQHLKATIIIADPKDIWVFFKDAPGRILSAEEKALLGLL